MTGVCNRPVLRTVENRLVLYAITILSVLLCDNMHVNSIAKQTSSDKTYVLFVIKALVREGLIIQAKDYRHGKKKITQLTAIGREIAVIIDNLKDYKNTFSKLRECREKNFTSHEINKAYLAVEDDIRAHGKTFRKIDWTNSKNDLYLYGARGVSLLEYECSIHITDILIFRFASMLKRFNLQQITKDIMDKIITDSITDRLEFVSSNILGYDNGSQMISGDLANRAATIAGLPAKLENYPVFINHAIGEDAKNFLRSIFSLLKPSQLEVQSHINKLVSNIRFYEEIKVLSKNYKHSELSSLDLHLQNLRSVLAFYEEINKAN
jgi:DNA-binding MarR family transcriptional regulator